MLDIVLGASAREWPDRLHRFLLDHGGGRIVGTAMSADQALALSTQLFLVDDVCSFLTPHLVHTLKRSGVEVVGVYQPEDGSDAKRRLLECGISDVIEAAATAEEFIEKVRLALSHRSSPPDLDAKFSPLLRVGVTGATEGVGITEVSIALAHSLSRRVPSVLVDLDARWPSVAQRLDLPVHPNLRTSIDHALHQPSRVADTILDKGSLGVVGGRADGGVGEAITRHEIDALMLALAESCEVVVADLGPLPHVEPGIARELDTMIVVGTPEPVGVARLIRVIDRVVALGHRSPLVALNLVARSRYRSSEAAAEIETSFPGVAVVALPRDPRIEAAAWDGELVDRGPFQRGIGSVAEVVVRSLS